MSVNEISLLPSPRQVSNAIHANTNNEDSDEINDKDPKHTLLLMQWGQFLAHDITLTPMYRIRNGSLENCSACQSAITKSRVCAPISIPKGDPFFHDDSKCLEFIRSQSILVKGQNEQLNKVTAWVDASQIYGAFACQANHLRSKTKGQMITLPQPLAPKFLKPLLPRHATNHECLSTSGLCFNAGEDRANEQPGLVSIHTLWVREHNRIAEHLAILNDHWTDEKIYQEARKIVIALNQHITYR